MSCAAAAMNDGAASVVETAPPEREG